MHFRAALMPTLLLAMSCGLGSPALAAEPPEPTYGYPSPEAARQAINRDEAAKAKQQLADNAAAEQAFEQAKATREEQIQQDQAAWEAEKTRLASDHAAAMDQWRADAAACRAGDQSRCKHR